MFLVYTKKLCDCNMNILHISNIKVSYTPKLASTYMIVDSTVWATTVLPCKQWSKDCVLVLTELGVVDNEGAIAETDVSILRQLQDQHVPASNTSNQFIGRKVQQSLNSTIHF